MSPGILARLLGLLGREPDLFALHIEPSYAIKVSLRNPYFQALEAKARAAGFLGSFLVDGEGRLRPGSNGALPALAATLALDVYPNPAVIEQRSVTDFEDGDAPRRSPRATLVLADATELFLWRDGDTLRVAGPAFDAGRQSPSQPP